MMPHGELMQQLMKSIRDALYPRTIRRKLTILLFAASALTYGLLTVIQYQALSERTVEFAQYTHRLMAEVMIRRIEDAVASGHAVDVDRTLLDSVRITQSVNRETIEAVEGSNMAGRAVIAAFAVFDGKGRLIKRYDAPARPWLTAADLSARVVQVMRSDQGIDGLEGDFDYMIRPIRVPGQGGLAGIVAIAWDMRSHFATVRATTIRNGIQGAAATIVLIILLLTVIQWWITRPIAALSRHFVESSHSGELGFVEESLAGRRDEIGLLASEFNRMVEILADSRQKLQNQSYVTGMAEMASGVLHNIRNALNPISVGIWKLEETARNASTEKIEMALAEFTAPETPAERRAKLASYLQAAAEKLGAQQARLAKDIAALGEHSRHIEQILQDVDLTGRRRGANDKVNLDKLVEDCARMIPNQGAVAIAVEIDPALARLPPAVGNRLTITQVVGNLLVNAAEAIRAAQVSAGRIEMTGRVASIEGKDMIHLEISDNGEGIAPEAMESLFRRGFSTKSEKKGGIGLHWCANSVIAMGGKIYATSAGKGQGATFHLLLPAVPSQAADPRQTAA